MRYITFIFSAFLFSLVQGQGNLESDTLAVRAILDSNGLNNLSVWQVIDTVNGRVDSLELDSLGLTVISGEIAELTAMTFLDISGNQITNLPGSLINMDFTIDSKNNRLCDLSIMGDSLIYWLDDHQYCPYTFCVTWLVFQDCSTSHSIGTNPTQTLPALMKISPNPFQTSVRISVKTLLLPWKLQVYDIRGVRIAKYDNIHSHEFLWKPEMPVNHRVILVVINGNHCISKTVTIRK